MRRTNFAWDDGYYIDSCLFSVLDCHNPNSTTIQSKLNKIILQYKPTTTPHKLRSVNKNIIVLILYLNISFLNLESLNFSEKTIIDQMSTKPSRVHHDLSMKTGQNWTKLIWINKKVHMPVVPSWKLWW